MIEATCAACGTLNRIAEADVPVGAKFVNCASCKSRVAVTSPQGGKTTALGGSPPKLPALPGKLPAVPARVPQVPAIPPRPGAKPAPAAPSDDIIDLADLPAPRRSPALGGEQSRPAPKSGLAAADEADLPAPKSTRPSAPLNLPGSGMLDIDDLLAPAGPRSEADLLAPRGVKSGAGVIDLGGLGAAGVGDSGVDLPAPKARGIADLPAPRGPSRASGGLDLLAPKGDPRDADLPMPKPREISDLPMPRGHGTANTIDLPTPKGGPNIVDLPTPKGPRGGGGEVAPKGFFDDLPQPAGPARQGGSGPDLPAPKGFFDDLPGTKSPSVQKPGEVAPKGFFDDLPATKSPATQKPGDIAPKGFFDDLPATKAPATQKPGDIAPKGFFDDLPATKSPAATKPGEVAVAPKGFFDDIPASRSPSAPPKPPGDVAVAVAPKGFFDDLPELESSGASAGPAGKPSNAPLDLDLMEGSSPELDLDDDDLPLRPPPPSTGGQFDDLDLSSPTSPPMRDIGARASSSQNAQNLAAAVNNQAPRTGAASPSSMAMGNELSLELESPRRGEERRPERPAPEAKPALDEPARKKRTKLIAGIAVGVLALGGGGAFFYQRHAAGQERAASITTELTSAREALAAGKWGRAATAAQRVIELDGAHAAALGVAAEASLAGALDDGLNGPGRIAGARKRIQDGIRANASSPEVQRAQALEAITTAQPMTTKLEQLVARTPNDTNLALYLAWGQAAKGDHVEAIKTLDKLVALPTTKRSALYARGRSKLALADLDGATADFTTLLAEAREHIGAMVGLAAALPPSRVAQQEADLGGIINRKDFAAADPRARVYAHVLVGDAARRAGRLDVARASYRDALKISDGDVAATSGLAEVELRDNKLDIAKELADKAVRLAPNDVRAQLLASQLSVRFSNFKDAEQRLALLGARVPPLAPLEQARLHLIMGELHEAKEEPDAAVESYIAGAKIAGDLDLEPTMAAVRKLTELAKTALDAKDDKRAADLKARRDELLTTLATKALTDPALALALGIAYLQSGDADKAEPLLRKATEARPNDPDPTYQLGKALARQGKLDEAIVQLKKGRELAGTRLDIAFELARTYETADRDSLAEELYTTLLATPELGVEYRGHACRFFGRIGQVEKAAAEGELIGALEPQNAAGLYCRGEGLLFKKKGDAARAVFLQAVNSDANAQYLDAQGRAAELVVEQTGETKFLEEAIRVYQLAHSNAPKMLNPLVGQARVYVARKEWSKAVAVLTQAEPLKPGDYEIAHLLGLCAEALGDKTGAITWLGKANGVKATADTSWRLANLYFDTNQPERAKGTLYQAIDLGEAEEKATDKPLVWITDAFYKVGTLEDLTGNSVATRKAWENYVLRNPKPGAQLNTVKQALATRLR